MVKSFTFIYKRVTVLIFLLGIIFSSNVKAQTQNKIADSTSIHHSIYLELGGAGLFYSLNYQFLSTHGFLLRVGAASLSDDFQVTIFPVGAGWYIPINDIINIEISGGLTFVNSRGSIVFNKSRSSFGHTFLGISAVSKSEERNDMFRIGVSPLIIEGKLGLWGSISMGFNF